MSNMSCNVSDYQIYMSNLSCNVLDFQFYMTNMSSNVSKKVVRQN